MSSRTQKCILGMLICMACVGVVPGQDLSLLTRNEYEITFNRTGEVISGFGDGYGGTWYYYPASDRYIMWFDNNGLDTNRIGAMDFWLYVEIIDPDKALSAAVSYGWTRRAWSAVGYSAPPLPGDMSTLSLESEYLNETSIVNLSGVLMDTTSTVEKHKYEEVLAYSPAWFFVSVSGQNANIYRQVYIGAIDEPFAGPPTPPSGACYNAQTGVCYMVEDGICVNSTYMGDGSDCSNFTKPTSPEWDFGDAPTSYGILTSHNGARHVVSEGVYLGQGVTREAEGQPSAQASADTDDGVQFITEMKRNENATLIITASTSGVINGWIDWNRDGDWADGGEQVFVDIPVGFGNTPLTFLVPGSAQPGISYLRIRFNTTGGLTQLGIASDGEVEDYMITILPGQDTPNPGPTLTPKSPADLFAMTISQPVDLANDVPGLISGWGMPANYTGGPISADDWTAADTKPLQGFRWWGLFEGWSQSSMPMQKPAGFHIGIWSDNPIAPFPSTLLWETTATCWVWAYSGQLIDARGQVGGDAVFEFTALLSHDNWFYPTAGTSYWVSISAIYGSPQQVSAPFAWLTRKNKGTLAAVEIQQIGSSIPGQIGQWPPVAGNVFQVGTPITYGNIPWDLAFQLVSSGPGTSTGCLRGDLNCDGVMDIKDVSILMSLWLD